MRIDQYVPVLHNHDAIGNHARQIRTALQAAGVESDLYVEVTEPVLEPETRRFDPAAVPLPVADDHRMLYHASTDSTMPPWLIERAEAGAPLLVYYHNITPPSFFARWLPEATEGMGVARRQLDEMAPWTRLAIAPSQYNEHELVAAGYGRTAVIPLLLDLESFRGAPDAAAMEALGARGSSTHWLFVGRFAPNKCQHDVIAAFAVYRRLYAPDAHLTLVGGVTAPRYLLALERFAADLEVGDAVTILTRVEHAELVSYFSSADVFVCLSEHEGYCVPLVEAMTLGLPVVAFDAAAVPETLDGAGELVRTKDPLGVAMAVSEILDDPGRLQEMGAAGRRRSSELALPHTSRRLVEALTGELPVRPGPGTGPGLAEEE